MWALCPSRYDNDTPMDLRKKVVLQREQEESLRQALTLSKPPALPVANLYPFVSERYGGQCSLVSPGEVRLQETRHGGSKGSLETAIRRLHQSRQQVTKTPKVERSRSADSALPIRKTYNFNKVYRTTSCPNLTFTEKPTPPLKSRSPIKPKSYFIQRSSGHLSEHSSDSIANSYHRTYENYRSNSPLLGGAKKRKCFVPVYGERSLSPKRCYDDRTSSPIRIHDDRTSSPKRIIDDRTSSPNRVYDNRTFSSALDYGRRPPSPKRRARSPEHTPEEYYPHSEVLLRRQLQQQTSPAYLVHVYDYYQQLVQRLREQTSPGVRLPPPMSPNSVDEDMTPDSQRKRPCRALTGKHVRQGTGASLSTLLTLRQKIQERQKAKEHDSINGFSSMSNKNAGSKKNKTQKMKPVMKSVLNKLHNC